MVVSEVEENQYHRTITTRDMNDLPAGEVLVEVHYSSLNYKDALSASGNKGVTRKYPHTPGIDASGIVVESTDTAFEPGDPVIVTSYDLGMNTAGGFGQYIRVPKSWVVPLPPGLTLRQAMCYGTAGFTAALSTLQLIKHGVQPDTGKILVSGATGGVGSIAVSILSKLGYAVTAVNGRINHADYLRSLGAQRIIDLEEAVDTSERLILKERWAGSIDAVGGDLLSTTVKSTCANGVVTTCGNVASPELSLSVYPFILRGVALVGIDSQNCPMPIRREVWQKLANEWQVPAMEMVVKEIPLNNLDTHINRMLNRERLGRTIVTMRDTAEA